MDKRIIDGVNAIIEVKGWFEQLSAIRQKNMVIRIDTICPLCEQPTFDAYLTDFRSEAKCHNCGLHVTDWEDLKPENLTRI